MAHPYLTGARVPRVLAHRGFVPAELAARGVAENTRAAFQAAVEAGAEYLETDCHVTADGAVVLFHDPTLARVADDPRSVASLSHAELADIMWDRGGLLTLEEMLEEFPRARINIDIKAEAAADPAGRILAPHAERVLIAGFDDAFRRRALWAAATKGARPATGPGRGSLIRILLALASRSKRAATSALSGFDALQIPERHGRIRVLSPRLIDEAHRSGVEVHVWTVNDPERMRELVALGVDGIITDRADLAVGAL